MNTAVAVGTLLLAAVTAWMAFATTKLGTEAKEDRQLAYRPQLSLIDFARDPNTTDPNAKGRDPRQAWVKNAGGGPAIGCHVVARVDHGDKGVDWWFIVLGDITAGKDSKKTRPVDNGKNLSGVMSPVVDKPSVTPELVMICSDVLGRRFRFPVTGPGIHDAQWIHYLPPDFSLKDQQSAIWATDPNIWP